MLLVAPFPLKGDFSIAQIKQLGGEGTQENRIVAVRGVVTSFSGWRTSFFLQDDSGGIPVERREQTALSAGDLVEVRGRLNGGNLERAIVSTSIQVIERAKLPAPAHPSFEELDDGSYDARFIEVSGVVHSAEVTRIWGRQILLMRLRIPGGQLSVHVLDYSRLTAASLIDSTVTVRGVSGTSFIDGTQAAGLHVYVSALDGVKIDVPAPPLDQVPAFKIAQIQTSLSGKLRRHRIRVEGIVTYRSAERGLYLESGGFALHVQTAGRERLHPGDRAEAIGFVKNGFSPGLEDASVHYLSSGPQVQPKMVTPGDIAAPSDDLPASRLEGRLVELNATVVEQLPSRKDQLWLLRAGPDKIPFQAELSTDSPFDEVAFEPQSEVKVVGVCAAEINDRGEPISFRLLLRSEKDITVAYSPHWEESFFFLLAGFALMLGTALVVWILDHIYTTPPPGAESAKRWKLWPWHVYVTSAGLCWLVFGCTLFRLLLLSVPVRLPDSLLGSGPVSFAMAVAALATCWNHSRQRWHMMASVVCSTLISIGGATALWHYRTPAGAGHSSSILEVRNGPELTVAVALCFSVLGLSIFLSRFKKSVALAQLLLLAVAALAILNMVTRVYSASRAYGIARHTAMPPFVAACFLLLSVAALLSRLNVGLLAPIFSSSYGGLVNRRLIPAALSIPLILGWFHLQGQMLGLYDTLFGLALFALANCFAFACMVWTSSAVLNRVDMARLQVEARLRDRDAQFELLFEKAGIGDYLWDLKRNEVVAHRVIWQLYGADPAMTKAPAEWFGQRQHPEDQEQIAQAVRAALDTGSPLEVEFRIIRPDGSIRWISCRANIVLDELGTASYVSGLNIDVTERKRSEAELLATITAAGAVAEQFQMGLEFSKVASWRWITATDQITWNGPVEDVFGIAQSNLSSFAALRKLILDEDIDQVQAAINLCCDAGVNFATEYRILAKGETRWIAGRGGALRDSTGHIYGLSGVNFDITNTKAAEQRLFESEKNFRELADAMPQIVWIASAKGEIEYCNRRWYEYTESSVGEDMSSFVHPSDLASTELLWSESLKTGAPFAGERRLKRAADNTYRWHLSRALPITDKKGQVCRWFGTSTDIDDYKRAQAEIQSLNSDLEIRVAELADKELHYRLLFEGVKDYAIFMLDSTGNVKSWNSGAEQLLGYTADDILGQHFSKFHNDEAVRMGVPKASLGYAVENGRFYEEGWRRRKDGKEFWASAVITSLLDSAGQLVGFCKIIRDMTEQRLAMSMLVTERQRAELANQAKSTFLAAMSHEIRTPMNSILGMADLLSETRLDATQREYVDRFQRAGSNLLTIINDILDLSRIESGRFELEEVPFDLEEVAQRALDLITQKAQKNHVNLAFRIIPGTNLSYIGDPTRLQQILVNLLGNAAKFTEEGEIVLTIGPHPDGAENHLRFQIADTGIGIPKDKLAGIFNDFTQAESSTTRRFGGTGLGLGIAERLARKMGGSITVESEPGVGSTFTVDTVFRKAPEPMERGAKTGKIDGELAGLRILIAESNGTNRFIYREMCSAWKMRPEVTASAAEAVSLLLGASDGAEPFSVVILDRFSPDLDAFQALQEIRAAGCNVPCLLTAADDLPGEATKALNAGFSGYAIKPVRRLHLMNLIGAAIRSKSSESLVEENLVIPEGKRDDSDMPKVKILVADDSEDNQFLIENYLKGSRYRPEFTKNGALAIELYQRNEFDLILMDVQMPTMDGLQATAAIRALEKAISGAPIPIIALTANAMADDIQKSRSAGCNAHLAKPISKAALLTALEEWQPAASEKT